MKLSKLRDLCDKAIEKYGDMTVGAFPGGEYAYDLNHEEDMYDLTLRILTRGGGLPGVPLEDNEEEANEKPSSFACIFYWD